MKTKGQKLLESVAKKHCNIQERNDQVRAIENVYDKAQDFVNDWENDTDGDPVAEGRRVDTQNDITRTLTLAKSAPDLLRAAKAIALRLDRFAKAWGNNPVFLASERAALSAAIRHAEGD